MAELRVALERAEQASLLARVSTNYEKLARQVVAILRERPRSSDNFKATVRHVLLENTTLFFEYAVEHITVSCIHLRQLVMPS